MTTPADPMPESIRPLTRLASVERIRWSVEQVGDGWAATVTAGLRVGPCPQWGGRGATADAALANAADAALSYWRHFSAERVGGE